MLSKSESKVMQVVYDACKDRQSFLISPLDLIKLSGEKSLDEKQTEKILDDLARDGYFDLVYSDRHGERVYCITITNKGKGFDRDKKVFKRNILFRLTVTVLLAIVSFIVGLVLKAIF